MSTEHHHHHHHKHKQVEHPRRDEAGYLAQFGSGAAGLPPGPFVEAYRIAGYVDGLVGASPECAVLLPHFDSGLTWCDANNPQPSDWCWDGGVAGGLTWDGTFHRDLARYAGSGPLFWCGYLKAGTAPGMKQGYWLNLGSGWSHLHNDNPAELLTGAAQKLSFDTVANHWQLVIQATQFVTHAVMDVWTGVKSGGPDPTGLYTRLSGLDPLANLTIEPAP
jgi:hypothetical protein